MRQIISTILLLLTHIAAYADASFTYNGKPIHPYCLRDRIRSFSAPPCKTPDPKPSECAKNSAKISMVNDNITTQDPLKKENIYTSYSIIGNYGDKFLINVDIHEDNHTTLSAVIWVKLNNDDLQLLNIVAAGMQCDRGTFKTGPWQYAINTTPYGMLMRTMTKPVSINKDDLNSSITSCAAKLLYTFNPETAEASFTGMKLNENALTTDDDSNKYKYQSCFNEIYNHYLRNGIHMMTQSDIDAFKDEFERQCIK